MRTSVYTTSARVVVYVTKIGWMLAAFKDDENALTRVTASKTRCSWASRHHNNHGDNAAATQSSNTRARRCVCEDPINISQRYAYPTSPDNPARV